MDIEEAKRMMAAAGYAVSESQQPISAEANNVQDPNVAPAGIVPAEGTGTPVGEESSNGYYEILMARLDKMGDVETFRDGQSKKQTLTFAYKNRRGEEYKLCCEAWNDQLNHDLQLGAYYDISLRLGCRTSQKDGRDFPTVTLAYAHRVRTVQMV